MPQCLILKMGQPPRPGGSAPRGSWAPSMVRMVMVTTSHAAAPALHLGVSLAVPSSSPDLPARPLLPVAALPQLPAGTSVTSAFGPLSCAESEWKPGQSVNHPEGPAAVRDSAPEGSGQGAFSAWLPPATAWASEDWAAPSWGQGGRGLPFGATAWADPSPADPARAANHPGSPTRRSHTRCHCPGAGPGEAWAESCRARRRAMSQLAGETRPLSLCGPQT